MFGGRITRALQAQQKRVGETGQFSAILGDGFGRVVYTTDPSRRMVYFNTTNAGERTNNVGLAILAEGSGIPFQDITTYHGTPIIVGYPPGQSELHVLRIAKEGYIPTSGKTLTEQVIERALLPVSNQIDLLRASAMPVPTMDIYVSPGPAYTNPAGYWSKWNGGVYTVQASELPSSGQHRLALLALDQATNTLSLKLGTAVTATGTLPSRAEFGLGDVLAIAPDVDTYPSRIVYLYNEQTVVVEDDFRPEEVRQFFTSPVSVVSLDRILTDNDGNVLSDNNGNVVYE